MAAGVPWVTSTPGATRRFASTFQPDSSRAAATNFDSQPTEPSNRTLRSASESRAVVVAVVPLTDAARDAIVGGTDTDTPPFWIRKVSIAPNSSRRITADPLGAAMSMRIPRAGDAIGSASLIVAGRSPRQLTLLPAAAIAASHARSTADGTALSRT